MRMLRLVLMLSIAVLSACGAPLTQELWCAKIHAGWLGKVAAGSGALPTELQSKDTIRRKYGLLTVPPQTPTPQGPLDDTTLAFLGWQAARRHGNSFTTADIAGAWVEHLTPADLQGGGFGSEFRDALARLRKGEHPPIVTGTPRAEWIAAQMRAEVWGMLAPGDAARAADYAERDAQVFNVGEGVHAARFVAAMASSLMVDESIAKAMETGLQKVPEKSQLAQLVKETLAWHSANPNDWESAWQSFVVKHRDRSLEKRFTAWHPQWLIETGGWPDAAVLDDYCGRRNVLRTHPFAKGEPAVLSTSVAVPAGGGTLAVGVNCNERPRDVDWLLRVRIDGDVVREETIRWTDGAPRWRDIVVDLRQWAGKRVLVSLENGVTGKFGWEAGFWTPPRLSAPDGTPLVASRPPGHPRYPLEFSPMILPETFAVVTGLLYGNGDFGRSVSVTTMCGFDTDCNAGTVGCLLGIRNGVAAIPKEWREPVGDRYELQVSGLPRQWKIPELAAAMAQTGAALARGGAETPRPARAGAMVPAPATRRTGRFTLMALGDNNVADLEPVRQRYDLMIASHSVDRGLIKAFRDRNPGARVFSYFNTSDVNRGWISDLYHKRLWDETNPHEDWFHHSAAGERVRIYYPKYKDRQAFNTGNPGLQRYLADRVVEILRTGLYDGIQLDNVSTDFPFHRELVGKWVSSVPVGLGPAQWTADEVAMLETVMRAVAAAGFAGKTIIFNHMRSGEPAESLAYLQVTDGANCESWLSQRTGPEGKWGWRAKVEQVRDANRAGELTNLLCVSPRPSEAEALFCYASYLMALAGDRAHFFYGSNYKIAGRQRAWYPFYDLGIGSPEGDFEARNGVFWRSFSKGAVVVNPGGAPATLSLPAGYVDLQGHAVKTVKLGPKEATLLQRPSAAP